MPGFVCCFPAVFFHHDEYQHTCQVNRRPANHKELSMVHSNPAKKNILVIDILNEISKVISRDTDVEFTRLLVGQSDVLISGNTDTFNAVDDMKNLIEEAGLFQKVTISSANINKSGNRVHFKLKVQL